MQKKQRSPTQTRTSLVHAAFQEIYRQGFQGASLDSILETASVTKGALYYHFGGKRELGYAVFDEVVAPFIRGRWLLPMAETDNPIAALKAVLDAILQSEDDMQNIAFGCPLNNLVQEMSPLDEGFRVRVEGLLSELRSGIERALRRGQQAGRVRADADPGGAALFVVAAVEGCFTFAKAQQSAVPLCAGFKMLGTFLDSLRA